MARFEEGKRYTVAVEGASLHGYEYVGSGAMRGTSQALRRGAVIEYLGSPMGWGSDSVREDTFRDPATGFRGAFTPCSWGSVREGALVEERTRAQATKALEVCVGFGRHDCSDTEDGYCEACDVGECADCLRPIWYRAGEQEDHFHLLEPQAECFLRSPDPEPGDPPQMIQGSPVIWRSAEGFRITKPGERFALWGPDGWRRGYFVSLVGKRGAIAGAVRRARQGA